MRGERWRRIGKLIMDEIQAAAAAAEARLEALRREREGVSGQLGAGQSHTFSFATTCLLACLPPPKQKPLPPSV